MKHTILFLAANPAGTAALALDEECKAIGRELKMAPARDEFEFRSEWAVSIDDLMQHLNEHTPEIVHFSGHGGASTYAAPTGESQHRDLAAPRGSGIYLQDAGSSQYVSDRALAMMIKSASERTRLVVLNACYSDGLGEALRNVVDCVVGANGSIDDAAARSFAMAFYRALGYRCSVGIAVDQALATLAGKGYDENVSVCSTRTGINAHNLFISARGQTPASRPPTPSIAPTPRATSYCCRARPQTARSLVSSMSACVRTCG